MQATPVSYVPWCRTVAEVAEQMQQEETEVASVVNEIGETIGIITMHDILDAILMESPVRSERMLNRAAIIELDAGVWHIAGMTNLRRLEQFFGVEFPTTRNVTLAGVVQETLERHPRSGDECQWGPLRIKALPYGDDNESPLPSDSHHSRGGRAMISVGLLLACGLLLSAFFSGSETGLYRVTRIRLALDGMSGDPVSKGLLWLVNNPAIFVATTLIGNNLANYLVSFSIVMATQIAFRGHHTVAEVMAPIVMTPIVFVYGELLPKFS